MYDLIEKKKINLAHAPDPKRVDSYPGLPGLTVISVSDFDEFEDALTLCLLNAKIKY